MDRACGQDDGTRNAYRILVGKSLGKSPVGRRKGDRGITLRCIKRKQVERLSRGCNWFRFLSHLVLW
jgi:hypothetical protein